MANQRPLAIVGSRIIDPSSGTDAVGDILVVEGKIAAIGSGVDGSSVSDDFKTIRAGGQAVIPGLVDMRVFIGEPGGEHRETLESASRAAAAGGVTTMVTMPDTDPPIDDPSLVDFILRRARDTAIVRVHPMAALTKGLLGNELTEIGLLNDAGAVAFTQGRRSLANAQVMRNAMTYARDFDVTIVHETQDPDLTQGSVMNEGETATRLGLPGAPAAAEAIMIDRDLRLVQLTGARYHAAQLSCAQAMDSVRRAKKSGLNISCAASIAHLSLNELDVGPYRTFFKMSPPLRAESDRLALVDALADGSLDIIVSAHDPQDVENKRQPFAEAADGAIGLETFLAVGLRLVHDNQVSLMRLVEAMSTKPAELLGLQAGSLKPGMPADLAFVDIDMPWIVSESDLRSRSKNSAFENARLTGKVVRTLVSGETVHECEADISGGPKI